MERKRTSPKKMLRDIREIYDRNGIRRRDLSDAEERELEEALGRKK